jgi:hypothetical protein
MIDRATGNPAIPQQEYAALWDALLADSDPLISEQFVRRCRGVFQFWQYCKSMARYDERREHIYKAFGPLLTALEERKRVGVTAVGGAASPTPVAPSSQPSGRPRIFVASSKEGVDSRRRRIP